MKPHPTPGAKTIRIPLSEKNHDLLLSDTKAAHTTLQKMIDKYPEIFPSEIKNGFHFYGTTRPSTKMDGLMFRKIQLISNREVFTIAPSYVMPFMRGKTKDIEKGIYLAHNGTSFDAVAYACGRNGMFWYRCYVYFSRCSIVGSTVRSPALLPQDLVFDEKHSKLSGEKVYIPTTAGNHCLLGADVTPSANADDLTNGYSTFKNEALNVDPNYSPKSGNTDGWEATKQALTCLFPGINLILCYLHSFLKVRDCCRKDQPLLKKLSGKIWKAYNASTKRVFSQRLRRLKEWAINRIDQDSQVRSNVIKLCDKRDKFSVSYDNDGSKRTSNMIDRLMRFMSNKLFARQYFHGNISSAKCWIRSYCLFRNFIPMCQRRKRPGIKNDCLASRLNKFSYVDDWLDNLIVCTSMNGYRQ